MEFLKYFVFTLLTLMLLGAESVMAQHYEVLFQGRKILVHCDRPHSCDLIVDKIEEFAELNPKIEFVELVKYIALNESILSIAYDDRNDIYIEAKESVEEISFVGSPLVDIEELERQLNINFPYSFSERERAELNTRIKKYLVENGFLIKKIDYKIFKRVSTIVLKINLDVDVKEKLKGSVINSDNSYYKKNLTDRIKSIRGKSLNRSILKSIIDQFKKDVTDDGYYFLELDYKLKLDETGFYLLYVDLKLGTRYSFDIKGNRTFGRFELLIYLKNKAKEIGRGFTGSEVQSFIEEFYHKRNLFNPIVKVLTYEGKTLDGSPLIHFFVTVNEGEYTNINNVSFNGNYVFSRNFLEKLISTKGTDLVVNGRYDKAFFEEFSGVLQKEYVSNGFLFADISSPKVTFAESGATIKYDIHEKQQCFLRNIIIKGVSEDLKLEILAKIKNRPGNQLDVSQIDGDLKEILKLVRSQGYVFAKYNSNSTKDILRYYSNYTNADLIIDIRLNGKAIFDHIVVVGNKKTKDNILRRESGFKSGTIITPEKIKEFRDSLNSLGLFSSLKVTPIVHSHDAVNNISKVKLLVEVKERLPGMVELSPGYRTDLGLKIGAFVSYGNLFGENHSISLKTQVNYRTNFSGFDTRRKIERRKRFEFFARGNYNYPYFLNYLDLNILTSVQRKRYFSFDADIFKVSPQFSKSISKYVSASVKYQFERIRQFDATQEKDSDIFQIGSLTPSLTYDNRDEGVAPRRGQLYSISWELANPALQSKSEENVEINFSKIITRTKFYLPLFAENFVLATAVSMGYEKNLADDLLLNPDGSHVLNADGSAKSRGYIPSLKVFHLDGPDSVRGFRFSEINRVEDGTSIDSFRIQNEVFFTNIKVEPRYYLSDEILLGLFFDAGRLFINKFKPLSLRTSAGVTFKFLTAIGTLDFDYGVKMHRNRFSDGSREGFGRFHLSIGVF